MKTTALLSRRILGTLLAVVMLFGVMQAGLVGIAAAPAICSHVYESHYDPEPTCIDSGIKVYACTKCTYAYTEETPAIGHTYDPAWIADEAKETMWHKCCRCDVTSEPRAYVAPVTEEIGFSNFNGDVLLEGEWFMKTGTNHYDAFSSIFESELNFEKETVDVLRERFQMFKDYNIPYIRFNAIGYGTVPMKILQENPDVYFAYMDLFVQIASEYNIGLFPGLFWNLPDLADFFGDAYFDSYRDPDSETMRYMQWFLDEFTTRYAHNPIIWGWELGNEWDLYAVKITGNHNGRNFTFSDLKTVGELFSSYIRALDPVRIISSGTSVPRTYQWNYMMYGTRDVHDTEEQYFDMVSNYLVTGGLDSFSVHIYRTDVSEGKDRWFEVKDLGDVIGAFATTARELGVPLLIGEYAGHVSNWSQTDLAHSLNIILPDMVTVLQACAEYDVGLSMYWSLWSYEFQGVQENVIVPGTLGEPVLDIIKAYNDAWDAVTPGDINDDGEFNAKDVTYALRALASPGEVSYDINIADVDRDLDFDTQDVILMMRDLAKWDNILLKATIDFDFDVPTITNP